MSSPPRVQRELVCPPAPKRLTREEQIYKKKETSRWKMIDEAIHEMPYMKTMREMAEKTPCGSDEVKAKMLAYFDAKILDLEIDYNGKPRYSYNLNYPTDIGFAPNGRKPEFANKTFNSVAEASNFIHDYIKSNEMMFDKKNYMFPSAEFIKRVVNARDLIKIDINDEDEDEDEEKVPLFTVSRIRVNY
jgi:hypothetical protein